MREKDWDATVEAGKEYEMTVVIDEKGLDNAIGLESVIIRHEENEDRIHEVILFFDIQRRKPIHFQGNNQNVQRWKLQTGIQNVSQPSPVTSPARFLLCTMVLNGHE